MLLGRAVNASATYRPLGTICEEEKFIPSYRFLSRPQMTLSNINTFISILLTFRSGVEPMQWEETASCQWQCHGPVGQQGRNSLDDTMKWIMRMLMTNINVTNLT